jgi:hypothetical protein
MDAAQAAIGKACQDALQSRQGDRYGVAAHALYLGGLTAIGRQVVADTEKLWGHLRNPAFAGSATSFQIVGDHVFPDPPPEPPVKLAKKRGRK